MALLYILIQQNIVYIRHGFVIALAFQFQFDICFLLFIELFLT